MDPREGTARQVAPILKERGAGGAPPRRLCVLGAGKAARGALQAGAPLPTPCALITGGEATEAAGGLVDGLSAARAREGGLDVPMSLARNDSHTALKAMGDLVVTGATGTNVADLRVVLVAG